VWDLSGDRQGGRERLSLKQREKAWQALAGDAAPADDALWSLATDPETPTFLRTRLGAASELAPARLARLLADLDADSFETRQQASAELERYADESRAALRRAMKVTRSAEVRRRIDEALRRVDDVKPPPELLRRLRALEALERSGTPEALDLVKALAEAADDARLTREAKATLARLNRR
jgi:hypothetical protein